MEFSKTDDVSLELSAIIEKISAANWEKVKLSGTISKLPSPYNDIMKTNFPTSSPKSGKKINNTIDSDIIDTISGLNIYNRQIISMEEVDKITCYYPELGDFEQAELSPAKKENDTKDPEESIENTMTSQVNSNENQFEDGYEDTKETHLVDTEDSISNQRTPSLENSKSYEKTNEAFFDKEEPEKSNDRSAEKNSQENVLSEETEYGPLIININEENFDEQMPASSEFSYVNLSEENKSILSKSQNEAYVQEKPTSSEPLDKNLSQQGNSDFPSSQDEANVQEKPTSSEVLDKNLSQQSNSDLPSSQTFLNNTEDQLSSNNIPQMKKKKSILKRLFSKRSN